MTTRPFDAVLIIAFGGPQGPADVRPFLENVVRGRRVPPARLEEVAHHYALFGGVSPITELTGRQASGLRERLRGKGIDLPVFVGMRNWHPFLLDTLSQMSEEGARRAIGFIAAPHRSYSSCQQYRENVRDARLELGRRTRQSPDVWYVGDWHDHPAFIAANAARVEAALNRLPAALCDRARLVFTAHSVPLHAPASAQYAAQIETSARLVAHGLGRADWAVVYQSRSGRPEDPWLEPDVGDYLERSRAEGLQAAVVCPIGFVSDHIEVLYDLDHELAARCREIDLPMVRASTVNDDPLFLDMMAELVVRTIERHARGRPLPVIPRE